MEISEQADADLREIFKYIAFGINSPENYNHFMNSGFHVICRDEQRTIEETLAMVEAQLNLPK